MNGPRPLPMLLSVASLLAVVASCVESRHPLSDEKTSKIDERLVGTWRFEGDPDSFSLKKSADMENALELTEADPRAGKTLLLTTAIKSKGYVSIKAPLEDAKKKPTAASYGVCQYVFVDNDTVEVRGMEPEVIEKAIADRILDGEIMRTRVLLFFPQKQPIITAAPQAITRYLEAHADECYPAKADVVVILKRQK